MDRKVKFKSVEAVEAEGIILLTVFTKTKARKYKFVEKPRQGTGSIKVYALFQINASFPGWTFENDRGKVFVTEDSVVGFGHDQNNAPVLPVEALAFHLEKEFAGMVWKNRLPVFVPALEERLEERD